MLLEPGAHERAVAAVGDELAAREHQGLGRLVLHVQGGGQAAGQGALPDDVDHRRLGHALTEGAAPGLELGLGAVARGSYGRGLEHDHGARVRGLAQGLDGRGGILGQLQTRMCLNSSRSVPRVKATPGRLFT